MRAIRPEKTGGPEILLVRELPTPTPGPEDVLVRVEAAAVHQSDIAMRKGLEKHDLPLRLGGDGAGIVEAIGESVTDLAIGQRVAWILVPGSYATHLVARRTALVPVPDGIDAKTAAATLRQGVIAQYLVRDTFPLGPNHTCFINAALLGAAPALTQLAKKLGATPIVTIGDGGGMGSARGNGATTVLVGNAPNLVELVRTATNGRGVDVVFDQNSPQSIEPVMRMLKPRGMLVIYGNLNGSGPPLDARMLAQRGSLYVTRPRLRDHLLPGEFEARAKEVFGWVKDGTLQLGVDAAFPLSAAKLAHQRIEERPSKRVVLVP
jgi:NADPH2:quinone reductase